MPSKQDVLTHPAMKISALRGARPAPNANSLHSVSFPPSCTKCNQLEPQGDQGGAKAFNCKTLKNDQADIFPTLSYCRTSGRACQGLVHCGQSFLAAAVAKDFFFLEATNALLVASPGFIGGLALLPVGPVLAVDIVEGLGV